MHSSIVFTAPSSFCRRSSAFSGVASLRSLVPRPMAAFSYSPSSGIYLKDSLGQLRPSKSIGGFNVYGLAGRLAAEDVGSGGSSRGSRGETSSSVEFAGSFEISFLGKYPRPLNTGGSTDSRSIGTRRVFDDRIEAVSLSRSLALTDVRARGEPPREL